MCFYELPYHFIQFANLKYINYSFKSFHFSHIVMAKQIPNNWNFLNISCLLLGVDCPRNILLYKVKVKDSLSSIFFNEVEENKSPNHINYNSEKKKYIFDLTKIEDLIQVGEKQLFEVKKMENNYKKEQKRKNTNLVNQFTQSID